MISRVAFGGAIATLVIAGTRVYDAVLCFKGPFDIVQIEYTPFAIFSNRVPMFDINFFNPKTINTRVVPIKEQIKRSKGTVKIRRSN